jgi:hypothetical protein
MTARARLAWFATAWVALAVVAALAPAPGRVTDRAAYEATAAHGIVRDCSDIHCFRVLVPWVLGRVPGPSTLKWKLYAAAANAGASLGVLELCLLLGVGRRAAVLGGVASAAGFGALYTLGDPFTADPLMYCLGPWMLLALLRDRAAVAGAIGAIGVLAKEFAAAPLYLFAAFAAVDGQAVRALRALAAANAAFIVWLALQLTLIVGYNYSYGGNPSTDLLGGGYLRPWLTQLSLRGAASAMVNEYTAFYILAPVGFYLADSRLRRLALVALPIAALFAYVQQPDRALWNFHFLAVPLGATVLDAVPAGLGWTTIGLFALANLKVGAQWTFAPQARVTVPLVMIMAAICGWRALAARRVAIAAGAGGILPGGVSHGR